MAELCILIPTYNEIDNITRLLPALRSELAPLGVNTRAVVIDDNSPDGTGMAAEQAGWEVRSPRFSVEVVHRPGKAGLGAAYVSGMRRAVADPSIDWVLTMDADFSHDPCHLPAFVEAAERAPLVVGSRYVPGGGVCGWPWMRRVLSVGGNWYTRAWLGSAVTDWTGGFNLYHRWLLARCDLASVRTAGYGFQIEMKRRALAVCRRGVQVPIVFADRTRGASKLPRGTALDTLVRVPRLRFAGAQGAAPVLAPERPVAGAHV